MSAMQPSQQVPVIDGRGLMARAWFVFLNTLTNLPSARLSGSKTYDPPNILAAGTTTTIVTVTGALLSATTPMSASASFSLDLGGLVMTAYVSAANTVTVVLFNPTGLAIDLGSGTLTAFAWKP